MVIIPENSRSCNAVCGRMGQMRVNTAVVNRSHLACAVVYCTLRDWLFLPKVREISPGVLLLDVKMLNANSLMLGCCGPIFLVSWPFFSTRSKWTLFPSGPYFLVDVISVDVFFHLWTYFSVDLFSEHRLFHRPHFLPVALPAVWKHWRQSEKTIHWVYCIFSHYRLTCKRKKNCSIFGQFFNTISQLTNGPLL